MPYETPSLFSVIKLRVLNSETMDEGMGRKKG